MNWKNRLTNYNFWISMFSAVLLILQALKIEFDFAYVNEIFTAVLGLLVVIGIISDPTKTSVKSTNNTNSSVEAEEKSKITEEKIVANNEVVENVKNSTSETIVLPIEEEVKVDDVNTENDIQTILTKFSTNLDEKMKELVQFNNETINKFNRTENNVVANAGKIVDEIHNEETSAVASPAVAEMSNPYVDVIN